MEKYKKEIYEKIEKSIIHEEPYPYIYIENLLNEELYEIIGKNYPKFEGDLENNVRYQINIDNIYEEPKKYEIMKKIIEEIFNEEFYEIIVKKFEKQLKESYKEIDFSKGIERRKLKGKSNKIRYDFQPGINSPVTRESSVRKPHIDSEEEIIAGLLYLREEDDDSKGGELVIYGSKKKIKINKRKVRKQEEDRVYLQKNEVINVDDLIEEKTIPYGRNNFVMFINTNKSIHGVNARSITKHNRRLINIIYEK